MKLMYLIFLVCVSYVGLAHAAEPAFYVVDARHTGDAVLHSTRPSPMPRSGLPYIVLDTPVEQCCFRTGPRPGLRKSPLKIDEDAPPLSSEEGEETFQSVGFVTNASAMRGKDVLAFGVEGMSNVIERRKRTYEITTGGRETVVVRHCLGTEGVNFRLYRSLQDKKPYATYYFALGYPVKSDCR